MSKIWLKHEDTASTRITRRKLTVIFASILAIIVILIFLLGFLIPDSVNQADFDARNLSPSLTHLFGTDHLGRDMLLRCIKGLSTSLTVGVTASSIAAILALIIGIVAAMGTKWLDQAINFLVDLEMSVPHIVLLMMISVAVGKGLSGVMIGIAITHWASLARIIRGEVIEIRNKHYISVSFRMGKGFFWIAKKHLLPHMMPQFFVGLILLFPHAIMHETGLTFLGYGLAPDQPAIGIILSEATRYLLAGSWWLTLFPGIALVLMVLAINQLGKNLRQLLDPYSANQ